MSGAVPFTSQTMDLCVIGYSNYRAVQFDTSQLIFFLLFFKLQNIYLCTRDSILECNKEIWAVRLIFLVLYRDFSRHSRYFRNIFRKIHKRVHKYIFCSL